jgi:hypothetical protein
MTVNSIPLYWGNPLVNREFNTQSFVNFYDFHSKEDMIDHIIELDKNNEKYLELLKKPWLSGSSIPKENKIENIKFLFKIFY